ncbi:hypothetical protein [Micromonospora sp. NPDC004551]|uniref:hypothetical protein n=1 Tax=Micromonospora sp. NPDC004551 TaxID=3154284 RepID=UPI0033AB0CCB
MPLWLYVSPSPTISPSTGVSAASDANPVVSLLCMVVVVAAVVMGISSSVKAKQRFDEAKRRADAMSDEELVALERKILGRLHRVHGADPTMRELSASAGETYEDACLATERLIRVGMAEIVEREKPEGEPSQRPDPRRRPLPGDQIRVTNAGSRYFHDRAGQEGLKVNGDYINVGSNSVVNNRSVVANSFNTIADRYDIEFARAMEKVEKAVVEAGNPEAQELLTAFTEALTSDRRQPSVLKRLFAGIIEAAPAVAAMTDVVTKISTQIAQ